MSKLEVPFLLLDNKSDYLVEFKNTFINCKKSFSIEGINILFTEEDFDHIFSEPKSDTKERFFSKRRAKRMYFIKTMIENYANYELMFEQETKHLAIFSLDLESVIYLIPLPKTKTLRVGTFFDFGRDHTKMYLKQKKKCVEISNKKELKEMIFK